MCGFLFTTKLIHDSDCNITLQRRGPEREHLQLPVASYKIGLYH